MRISGNDMRYNIGSIYSKKSYYNNQSTNEDHSNDTPSDSASFSEQGKQFSALMSRVQSLDTDVLESTVTDIRSEIQSLSLGDLDLDAMSREDLEGTYNDVNTTLNHFMEDANTESDSIDTDLLSDDDLQQLISTMKTHSDELISSFDNLERMGNQSFSGHATQSTQSVLGQRLSGYSSQMAISTKNSTTENIDLIQSLVIALEEDSQLDSSNFYNTVANYISSTDEELMPQLVGSH